jgi:hypothetical protein
MIKLITIYTISLITVHMGWMGNAILKNGPFPHKNAESTLVAHANAILNHRVGPVGHMGQNL